MADPDSVDSNEREPVSIRSKKRHNLAAGIFTAPSAHLDDTISPACDLAQVHHGFGLPSTDLNARNQTKVMMRSGIGVRPRARSSQSSLNKELSA